jgi:hypothetical protein
MNLILFRGLTFTEKVFKKFIVIIYTVVKESIVMIKLFFFSFFIINKYST